MLWGLLANQILELSNTKLCTFLANRYNMAFPDYNPLISWREWIYGDWVLGNDFSNISGFYGAYPKQIWKRYNVMFYWARPHILHLFSGSIPHSRDYVTLDCKQEADVICKAEEMSLYFEDVNEKPFKIIFADPPYTKQDAKNYGTGMPNVKKVVRECFKVLEPGGLLVWLDTSRPHVLWEEFDWIGTIGIIRA